MIIERSLENDVMVRESMKLLQQSGISYDEVLARQVVHPTDGDKDVGRVKTYWRSIRSDSSESDDGVSIKLNF